MKACVFNIQKFSLHDGPGIRTVVFLKGCPLRCQWCANPESQRFSPEILRDAKKCALCGACAKACPRGAIQADGAFACDRAKCDGCGACVKACPNGALTLEGEYKTIDEVVQVCLQDVDFYEESGGGVTISGGEALAQPEFARALLDALHKKGIHTAIETTGYAQPDIFVRVTEACDLVLFDMKHWDERKHREGTGVSNAPILVNLRRLAASGRDYLVRIPVIPGYNDSLKDAEGFAKLLKEMNIPRAQLLPFHQFGEGKYDSLGMEYRYKDVPALHPEILSEYRYIFRSQGIVAFF